MGRDDRLPDSLTIAGYGSINLRPRTPEDIAKAREAIALGIFPAAMFDFESDEPIPPFKVTVSAE